MVLHIYEVSRADSVDRGCSLLAIGSSVIPSFLRVDRDLCTEDVYGNLMRSVRVLP